MTVLVRPIRHGSSRDGWVDDASRSTVAMDERLLTARVSVLVGANEGRYPSGNSLVVRGDGEAVIIDPSVTVVAQRRRAACRSTR